jgi:hypothetical protein
VGFWKRPTTSLLVVIFFATGVPACTLVAGASVGFVNLEAAKPDRQ